jgi:hypothetical protein
MAHRNPGFMSRHPSLFWAGRFFPGLLQSVITALCSCQGGVKQNTILILFKKNAKEVTYGRFIEYKSKRMLCPGKKSSGQKTPKL